MNLNHISEQNINCENTCNNQIKKISSYFLSTKKRKHKLKIYPYVIVIIITITIKIIININVKTIKTIKLPWKIIKKRKIFL